MHARRIFIVGITIPAPLPCMRPVYPRAAATATVGVSARGVSPNPLLSRPLWPTDPTLPAQNTTEVFALSAKPASYRALFRVRILLGASKVSDGTLERIRGSHNGRAMNGLIPLRYKRMIREQIERAVNLQKRLYPSRGTPLPNCLIIGTQKGGTTSLFANLRQHPGVRGASRKEVHYFDLYHHYGPDWYRSFYPPTADKILSPVLLESSPYYLFHPAVPSRVRELLPDAKFIALLRDPIDRAYSHHLHARKRGLEPLGLTEALDAEANRLKGEEERLLSDPRYVSYSHRHQSYQARGLYARQLARWLDYFPRDRFLLLKSEDLFNCPDVTMSRILDFLGLEPWAKSTPMALNVNRDKGAIPEAVRDRLRQYYAEANEKLRQMVGLEFDWDIRLDAAPPSRPKPKDNHCRA